MHVPRPRTRKPDNAKVGDGDRSGSRTQPARAQRAPESMAKRGVKPGRWIVAGGLIGFVIVSAAVIAMRSYGHREGIAITQLERRKANLESERVRLDQEIRTASSRGRLVPIAEQRLGMRVPNESQIVVLERPARSGGTP